VVAPVRRLKSFGSEFIRLAADTQTVDAELRPTTVAAGFVGSLAVLGALLYVIGIGDVVAALRTAKPAALAAIVGVAAFWLVSWALSLRTVLGVLDAPVGVGTAVAVFAASVFANNVTPFGQAGGEPLSAWFIADATDTEYETGFAAIASVDALHFAPSLGLGLVGLGYFAATVTFGRRLELVGAAVAALSVALPAVAYVGWRHRYEVEERVVAAVTPAVRRVGGLLPRVEPPTPERIRERIEGFFHAIERVATDRRGLAAALAYSALGWLALTVSLWLSLYALGFTVPYAAVLVAIPVGGLAAAAPLPGGLGGVETVLVLLLVTVTAVDANVVGAAVLVHRAAVYWLPTVVGGGSAAIIATH
jgi:uncharacterized protein (TIRG00374 family)